MQTNFTPKQLSDPLIAESRTILGDCVHYGFCIPVCPTFVLLGDENDSPRGRIDLIRGMLEQGGVPAPATVRHIDQCLSCLACMGTCAARVDYMHLVDNARVYIERNYRRPLPDRLMREFVAWALANTSVLRALLFLGRVARSLARVLPGRLGAMARMVPVRPDAAMGPESGTYPAIGQQRLRVGVHTGCVQQVLGARINGATVRLLQRHGCEVVVKNDAGCCGALNLHLGKEDAARRQALKQLEAWQDEIDHNGLDVLVINTSGCGTVLKDYRHLFRDAPDHCERAARLAERTRDVTEVMAMLGLGALQPQPYRVAYHDACSLQHGQKISQQPRTLLRAAGFEVRDVPEKHFCCGSAGTYNLLQPDIAGRLGRRKAAHIDSLTPEIVAAGNLGCMMQIARFTDVPVVHTVELLDWATGGERPVSLAGIGPPRLAAIATGAPAQDQAFW